MKLSTPRWWYRRDRIPSPVLRTLLKPASLLWAHVTARRIATTPPYDAAAAVVCVGGLTLGGVGKTPVVRAVMAHLADQGLEVCGLSRGYGGRLRGPAAVDPAIHSAADVGDEPLMLAAEFPVVVAKDRVAGSRLALRLGAKVIVMDDGHQNPRMKKTVSLVVVDGETRDGEWPFGDGAVFPAGPMRERLHVGLARADAVVLLLPADLPEADPSLLALLDTKPILIARLEPLGPPPPGPQLAFAGIAKPWKFERALRAAGCDLVDFAPFPDHAAFSEGDLAFLAERAKTFGADLLTTEKDWVRLPPAWRAKVDSWPVRARFEDEAALDAVLASVPISAAAGTARPPEA